MHNGSLRKHRPGETMKNPSTTHVVLHLSLLVLLSTINYPVSTSAQGSAFTYQGRLNAAGQPANGVYDLRFRLSSDAFGNSYVGSSLLINGQAISNGLC